MAGTVTTTTLRDGSKYKRVHQLKYACTGDAADGGSVPDQTISGFDEWFLYHIETVPGAGAAAPSAVYDVEVKNSRGTDLLQGTGADRSVTAAEIAFPAGGPPIIDGDLTVSVGDLGNSNTTTLVVTLLRED